MVNVHQPEFSRHAGQQEKRKGIGGEVAVLWTGRWSCVSESEWWEEEEEQLLLPVLLQVLLLAG